MVDAPETVIRLFLAQRGRCFHCLAPMLMSPAVKKHSTGSYNDGWTREHIIPISKRGPRGYRNVVLAHSKCNSSRGNADPTPEMLVRCARIWERMRESDRKEVRRIANDPALRGTYMATYDYDPGPNEPKFIPNKRKHA